MNVLISLLTATLLTQQAAAQQTAPDTATQAKYQIGIQDQLKITVLDEADLTGSYRVDSDGTIQYPYLNRVHAAGMTLGDLQEKIRSGLVSGQFLRNPQVRIEIESYKSQSVMVGGEVRNPGKVPMTDRKSVLEALATAGSPTSTASNELTIARKKPGDPTA